MSAWWQSLEDGSLDMDIFGGNDPDGNEYSVVDLRYVYSEDDDTEILIGEYPWGEDTWINISVGGSTADMSDLREDICVMLGSFSRNMQSDTTSGTAEQDGQPAPVDETVPETGVAAPVTAALAAGGAAVMMIATRKNKRK